MFNELLSISVWGERYKSRGIWLSLYRQLGCFALDPPRVNLWLPKGQLVVQWGLLWCFKGWLVGLSPLYPWWYNIKPPVSKQWHHSLLGTTFIQSYPLPWHHSLAGISFTQPFLHQWHHSLVGIPIIQPLVLRRHYSLAGISLSQPQALHPQ